MINPRNRLRSPALSGIAVMCLGVACFSVNDAIGKLLTDRYSPLQILFMRNVIALPIALFLALRLQGTHALRSSKPFVHLIRGVFWVLAMDLSRFRAAPIAHLCSLCFEGQGAFPA